MNVNIQNQKVYFVNQQYLPFSCKKWAVGFMMSWGIYVYVYPHDKLFFFSKCLLSDNGPRTSGQFKVLQNLYCSSLVAVLHVLRFLAPAGDVKCGLHVISMQKERRTIIIFFLTVIFLPLKQHCKGLLMSAELLRSQQSWVTSESTTVYFLECLNASSKMAAGSPTLKDVN